MLRHGFFLSLLLFSGLLQAKDTIRLVSEISPPYQYYQNDVAVGTNIDLIQSVFDRANLAFPDVELYPWARAYKLAKKTPNTFIFPVVRTPEREDDFVWVAPIFRASNFIYGLKARDDIHLSTLSDIKHFKLAVVSEGVNHQFLRTQGLEEGSHYITRPDPAALDNLFFNGKLDLLIASTKHFKDLIKHYQLDESLYEVKFSIEELAITYYLAASKESDKQLIESLRLVFPEFPNK